MKRQSIIVISKGHPVTFAQTDEAALKSELTVAVMQAAMSILPLVMQLSETKSQQQPA